MVNKSLDVIFQDWVEYEFESGWGAIQRSDGISLHLNNDDLINLKNSTVVRNY